MLVVVVSVELGGVEGSPSNILKNSWIRNLEVVG